MKNNRTESNNFIAKNSSNGLPPFIVPYDEDEKIQWAQDMVWSLARKIEMNGESFQNRVFRDTRNMELYKGSFTKDLKYITETYGQPFPAPMNNYTLIKPQIDRLAGELQSRPSNALIMATNSEIINKKLERKSNAYFDSEFEPELDVLRSSGVDYPKTNQTKEEIETNPAAFLEEFEIGVQNAYEYLSQRYDFSDKFLKGFANGLVMGSEFYRVYIRNGDPYMRVVDKRNLNGIEKSTDPYYEDCSWIGENRFLDIIEILEEFGPKLSEKNIEDIQSISKRKQDGSMDSFWWNDAGSSATKYRVCEFEWKSLASLRYLERSVSEEIKLKKIITKKWKKQKWSDFKEKPFVEIWQGVIIAGIVVTNLEPRPNQPRNTNNYSETSLSYVGGKYNIFGEDAPTIPELLEPVQTIYNVIIWNLFRLLQTAAGKAVIYDVSQLPDGYDIKSIMYHAKVDNFILINSKQEGNQYAGHGSGFNQFNQIDFTLSGALSQYIELKTMCEDLAFKITGIHPARMGDTSSETGAGVQRRQIMESSLTTEPFFHRHSGVKRRAIQRIVDLMKLAWEDGKEEAYYLPDGLSKFLNLKGDFSMYDYGVFVNDGGKDAETKKLLSDATMTGFQTGQVTFIDMVEILSTTNLLNSKKKLIQSAAKQLAQKEQSEAKQMEIQQQANELKSQVDQEMLKLQTQKVQQDGAIAQMADQTKKVIQDMADQTKIRIKQMELSGKIVQETVKSENQMNLDQMKMGGQFAMNQQK